LSTFFLNLTQLGRTGALKLHAKAENGYKIVYKDFCSLYPATMLDTAYPIGHPQLEIHQKQVDWRSSADNTYTGIIKAFIIPPQNLRIPVLPKKLNNGRLAFILCNQCSIDHPRGLKTSNYNCQHNESQRGWIATSSHIELNAALDRGYRVNFLVRTLHWEEWTSTIFKPYIKFKQFNS
jgi:hypothetical protein